MKLTSYKRYLKNNDILITRLSPNIDSVIISFLSDEKDVVVFIKQDNKLIKEVHTSSNTLLINELPKNSELTVQVVSKTNRSLVRKFHTGDYRHPLINYVDKEETQYDYSGNFLGSPFICKFKGKLWVTMDIFKNGGVKNNGHIETMLFVSLDEGKSWEFVCDFVPAQWGRLFVSGEKLYYYGSNITNNTIELISSDNGYTWSDSICICKNGSTSPTSIVVNNDYVVISFRIFSETNDSRIAVIKGNVKSGLMNEKSWLNSNEIVPDFSWGGDQNIHYAEEGNVVEYNGKIFVLLRFACRKVLMLRYSCENNVLEFYKIIDMECGWCKFFISKKDDTYYAIGNHLCFPRQIVKLYSSKNLEDWNEVKVIDDISNLDKDLNGIQYPSFFIEDNKIYLVLRIALNGAETFHNSNATGFDIISIKK